MGANNYSQMAGRRIRVGTHTCPVPSRSSAVMVLSTCRDSRAFKVIQGQSGGKFHDAPGRATARARAACRGRLCRLSYTAASARATWRNSKASVSPWCTSRHQPCLFQSSRENLEAVSVHPAPLARVACDPFEELLDHLQASLLHAPSPSRRTATRELLVRVATPWDPCQSEARRLDQCA